MAALTDEQKQQVAAWLDAGAKPADVQSRLESEFELRMTYMEVRFLIDDLKLMPKDPTPPPAPTPPEAPADAAPDGAIAEDEVLPPAGEAPLEEGLPGADDPLAPKIAVKVDSITRPGAMVSGSAVFTDGKKVDWYLDQYGRLGMVPPEPGYRPSQTDLVQFQMALEKELMKQGY